MAAAFKLDALKFARRLTRAGLSEEVAQAIVEGIGEVDASELATKTAIAEVKSKVAALRTELKSDIAGLETIVADLRADIYGRLRVMGIGIVGLTVALIKILP